MTLGILENRAETSNPKFFHGNGILLFYILISAFIVNPLIVAIAFHNFQKISLSIDSTRCPKANAILTNQNEGFQQCNIIEGIQRGISTVIRI
jgi:hypothetical protein